MMNAGLSGIAAILSIATVSVARASGFAGFSKPIWLSEIWMNEKPASAALAEPISRDDGTPPATVQTTPVPAHNMHFRVCRRSKPPSRSFVTSVSSIGEARRQGADSRERDIYSRRPQKKCTRAATAKERRSGAQKRTTRAADSSRSTEDNWGTPTNGIGTAFGALAGGPSPTRPYFASALASVRIHAQGRGAGPMTAPPPRAAPPAVDVVGYSRLRGEEGGGTVGGAEPITLT